MSKPLGINRLKESKLLKDTSFILLGKALAMLFFLLLDIVAARFLSVEEYAEWVFFFSVLTILHYIGWFGINSSAKVFISKETEKERIGLVIRSAFFLRVVFSVGIGLVIFALAGKLSTWLGYPEKYPKLRLLLLIAPALVILNSVTEFYKQIMQGLEKYKYLCIITTIEYAGYFIISFVLLLFSRNVFSLAIGYIISGLIVFTLGMFLLYKVTGSGVLLIREDKTQYEWKNLARKIIKYAVPLAFIGLGGFVLVEMDTFMLGILSSKQQVANYGIAKSLCTKISHVNNSLIVGSMTSFSVINKNNLQGKSKRFYKIFNLNLLLSLFIGIGILLFGEYAITLMYGNDYNLAGQIIKLLIPYYILYSVTNYLSSFLDFQGEAKIRGIMYISVVFLNFLFNWLLIPILGGRGAALATCISLVPYSIFLIIWTIRLFRGFQKEFYSVDAGRMS